jgi:hypothetical protein
MGLHVNGATDGLILRAGAAGEWTGIVAVYYNRSESAHFAQTY